MEKEEKIICECGRIVSMKDYDKKIQMCKKCKENRYG